MKTGLIAALAAAQLTAAAGTARAADLPPADVATQQRPGSAAERLDRDVEISLGDVRSEEPRALGASESQEASAAQPDEPRKKRKSTGDKVLTGAAIVLGVGALAVGGLLVAIFVN